jgi:hypothetical protein
MTSGSAVQATRNDQFSVDGALIRVRFTVDSRDDLGVQQMIRAEPLMLASPRDTVAAWYTSRRSVFTKAAVSGSA